jgi:hypothetical protein
MSSRTDLNFWSIDRSENPVGIMAALLCFEGVAC